MTSTVLLPGTLCDERIFGKLTPHLTHPVFLDFSDYEEASEAAAALLHDVPAGSIGVAFSLGGWVLLEMLRLAPERFRFIILLSGNAHPDDPSNAAMRLARVQQASDHGFKALFAKEWPLMLGPDDRHDEAMRTLIVDMAEIAGHARHNRQAALNIARPDLRALAENPPVPIHVIAGAHDGLCPLERYEAASSGPDSSLTIVPGAGHYVPLEAPEKVIELLRNKAPEALL